MGGQWRSPANQNLKWMTETENIVTLSKFESLFMGLVENMKKSKFNLLFL